MKIKIRFYSSHKEKVGKSEVYMKFDRPITLRELFDELQRIYPKLRDVRDTTLFSLNHRYARGDENLKDGDEIALFPPIEGG